MTIDRSRPISEVLMEAAGLEDDDVAEQADRAEVIGAHQIGETRFCKRPNCDREAVDKRGPYGLLCQGHKDQAMEIAREERQREGVQPPRPVLAPAPTPSEGGTPVDLVKLASDLAKPARRLQRALDARKMTREEARNALTEFKASLDAIRAGAQTLIEETK